MEVNNNCCCYLILLFVLSRSVNNGRSHRPSNVAVFALISVVNWNQFFFLILNIFAQNSKFLTLPQLVDN